MQLYKNTWWQENYRLINEDFTKIKAQILLIWNINYLKNKQYRYIMKRSKNWYIKKSQIYVLDSQKYQDRVNKKWSLEKFLLTIYKGPPMTLC